MEFSFNILLFYKEMTAKIPSEWTGVSHKMPYCSILSSKLSSETSSAIFSNCIHYYFKFIFMCNFTRLISTSIQVIPQFLETDEIKLTVNPEILHF